MAMTNTYKNKILKFYKLFDTARLMEGTVSKSSYSTSSVIALKGIEFNEPNAGIIQTNNIQFTVPGSSTPNMLELSTQNPLQFGGTKSSKVYVDDYTDVMDNLDGLDKEYVVGKKKINVTVYDFTLYDAQSEFDTEGFDDLAVAQLTTVTGAFDNWDDVYSAFASANSQWVSGADSWFAKFKIVSSGSMPSTRGIARHSSYLSSKLLGSSLTFKQDDVNSNVVYNIENFTQEGLEYETTGLFVTKIIQSINKGAI